MSDNINPSHYKSDPSGVECIEVTRHRDFLVGNAIKYLWRAGLKEAGDLDKEIEDLNKSIWYVQERIALLEKVKADREERERAIQDSINVAIARLDVTKIKPFDGPTPEPDEACDCGGD